LPVIPARMRPLATTSAASLSRIRNAIATLALPSAMPIAEDTGLGAGAGAPIVVLSMESLVLEFKTFMAKLL